MREEDDRPASQTLTVEEDWYSRWGITPITWEQWTAAWKAYISGKSDAEIAEGVKATSVPTTRTDAHPACDIVFPPAPPHAAPSWGSEPRDSLPPPPSVIHRQPFAVAPAGPVVRPTATTVTTSGRRNSSGQHSPNDVPIQDNAHSLDMSDPTHPHNCSYGDPDLSPTTDSPGGCDQLHFSPTSPGLESMVSDGKEWTCRDCSSPDQALDG